MTLATRRLGRTGHASSLAVLGGAAFAKTDAETTERAFRLALDAGVNHLDIAPQYLGAERVVGPLVPAVRDRMFVAGKTLRRNADGVRAQLEQTMQLLGCDRLDLYQMHAVCTLEDLDDRAAAAEAILRARDEGLVRFVGITGHDLGAPVTHAEALRRYDLDTVMFPVNARLWAEPAYRADAEALLALAAERDAGVMAIKAGARRPWDDGLGGGLAVEGRPHDTWYRPWTDAADLERAVRFTLSVPGVHALCTPGDVGLLPTVLDACARYQPMDEAQREEAIRSEADEPMIFPMPA